MNKTYVYTGNPINPRFTLNMGDRVLDSGTDFDVDITDNINVGIAHVKITGKGRFTGVLERTFEITPVPAKSLSFYADQTEFPYTGEPCTMQIAVKFGQTMLTEGGDYDVEYQDNIEPGRAKANLRFKGNFSGVMSIPFMIVREEAEPAFDEDLEDEDLNDLTNTSSLSAETIRLGESVVVTASAEGGIAPYTYSVYYKKVIAANWTKKQDFSENAIVHVLPKVHTRYHIMVTVKDQRGATAKKLFVVKVTKPE